MLDMDLVLIFTFVVVITSVVGVAINGIITKVYAHQRWEKEQQRLGSQSSAHHSNLADRTDMIEDRLKVLERLATDRGTLLSDEIEALRDDRAKAEQRTLPKQSDKELG